VQLVSLCQQNSCCQTGTKNMIKPCFRGYRIADNTGFFKIELKILNKTK